MICRLSYDAVIFVA